MESKRASFKQRSSKPRVEIEMSEDRAKQLAMILQAIDDAEMEFAEYRTNFKERMTRLTNSAATLKRDILSGQMTITELPQAGD